MEAIKRFKLSKSETLMMVNDPPTTALHIQLLVDDSEERLTEDEVAQLLEITKVWLLPKEEPEDWCACAWYITSNREQFVCLFCFFISI